MITREIINHLKKNSNPKDRVGMSRFGIDIKYALGVKIPVLRSLAKKLGKNHKLALDLWKSKIHEARILASMIDEPQKVSEKQIEEWVKCFNSWDICDQVCMNLFDKTDFAWKKISEWPKRKEEFVKRAGFALMACLAWHDKKTPDKEFIKFFPIIKKYSDDERNFVKKAVNWALRQTGKKNNNLKKHALKTAKEILKINNKTAQWIAADALRELKNQ
ncbi:MAG: DNA alkylation repair protein [bacterium]|nr:DNA alkylation repair protein [bacterium]